MWWRQFPNRVAGFSKIWRLDYATTVRGNRAEVSNCDWDEAGSETSTNFVDGIYFRATLLQNAKTSPNQLVELLKNLIENGCQLRGQVAIGIQSSHRGAYWTSLFVQNHNRR